MPGITGNKTRFKIDNAAGVLTDISTWLNSIEGGADTEELDATTFQPDVSNPTKNILAGFSERNLDVEGVWSPDAEVLFSGIENKANLRYEYGPEGSDSGKVKISGLCNALGWSGPSSSVGAVTPFSMSFKVVSRTVGTY